MRELPDLGLITHATIVLAVVLAATVLRFEHDLDTATVATVFGAALGFAPRVGRTQTPGGDGTP